MQTLTINMPQALRAQLQVYQNGHNMADPAAAIVAIVDAYLQLWSSTATAQSLPAMYDAEDGPCEVLPSFLP
ncbi:MAG: hypothetical protein HC800_15245 [Phormidesmis sp. RL_2_1]|nr:hypothetical protein [Phormidesmis sp. RL_2_1]